MEDAVFVALATVWKTIAVIIHASERCARVGIQYDRPCNLAGYIAADDRVDHRRLTGRSRMTNAADAVAGRVFGDDAADQCRLGSNTEPTAGTEQPASVLGVIADDRATDELGFCPGPWGARSVVPDKHAAAVARAAVLRDRAVEEGGAAVRDRDAAAVTVDSAAGNDQCVKDDQPCYARRWSTPDHFKDAALLLGVNRDGRCAVGVGFAAERDVGGADG